VQACQVFSLGRLRIQCGINTCKRDILCFENNLILKIIMLKNKSHDYFSWLNIVGGIVLVLTCLVRIRLLGVPLERDEGEYAYMAQQLLKGVLPYTESYSMKLPGIYIVYAVILTLFGHTHLGIHGAFLIVNLITALLLLLIGRRLLNSSAGVAAGIFYLVLTISPAVQGVWANAEHFVVLFALGGFLLLLEALKNENSVYLLMSGILLGFSFLIKQHGGLLFIFGVIYIFKFYSQVQGGSLRKTFLKSGLFFLGGITPLFLTALIYFTTNNFEALWFWTFVYSLEYISLISVEEGVNTFLKNFSEIFKPNFLIIIFSLFGIIFTVWSKSLKPKHIFSLGLFTFSFLAIVPGLYFRPHYFVMWLPAISLCAGIGLNESLHYLSSKSYKAAIIPCIFLLSLILPIGLQKDFLFNLSPIEATREVYKRAPFPESLVIADFIKRNSNDDDTVTVLGPEPQIYFYSNRKSTAGFIYTYFLMEKHGYVNRMKEMFVKEIESGKPKFIVVMKLKWAWLSPNNPDPILSGWSKRLIQSNYELKGKVDIVSFKQITYLWGDEVLQEHSSKINNQTDIEQILIYKLKT
jgi:hypothetical protein